MQAVTPVQVSHPYRRKTASQWQQFCDAYEGSRLTRKQFCQKHSLALSTFDYWRHKLKKQSTEVEAMDFARGIIDLMNDADRRNHLAKKGKKLIDECYNYGKFRQWIKSGYDRMLEGDC